MRASSCGLIAAALWVACAHAPDPAPAPDAPDPYAKKRALSGVVGVEYWARVPARETALPVLLIPGMTGYADAWRANADLVDGLLGAGHRVIAVSLRGRGGSDSPATGWTLEDHVADLDAVLRAEGVGRVHVVAHSMGVVYGLGLALRDPARVASFTAGDYLPLLIRVTEAWVSAVGGDADNRRRYDRKLARRVFDEQGEVIGTHGDEQIVRDLRPELGKLTAPVLVIQATRDVPEARLALDAEAWRGSPALRLQRVDTGHAVFAHPDVVAATLKHVGG